MPHKVKTGHGIVVYGGGLDIHRSNLTENDGGAVLAHDSVIHVSDSNIRDGIAGIIAYNSMVTVSRLSVFPAPCPAPKSKLSAA